MGFNALIFFKTEKWYFSSHLNYPKSVTNNLQLLIRVSERHHRNYARVCSFSFPFIKQLITVRCIFLITTKPSEILSSQLLRFTVLKKHSFLFVCKNLRKGLKNQSVTTFKQKSIESKQLNWHHYNESKSAPNNPHIIDINVTDNALKAPKATTNREIDIIIRKTYNSQWQKSTKLLTIYNEILPILCFQK